jgi:hypothetical protein
MKNSIALPINALNPEGTGARAFRPTTRYGWREIPFYRFYPSTLEWVTHQAKRNQFIFPGEQYWTDPLFFPEAWPPHRVQDYLDKPGTQMPLFP